MRVLKSCSLLSRSLSSLRSPVMKKKATVVIALTLLVFVSSFGQEECALTETWKSGSTNQGGYSFNFQSNHGKDCRVYRVQNRPGRLLTPVLWKDSREIYIKTNLLECER